MGGGICTCKLPFKFMGVGVGGDHGPWIINLGLGNILWPPTIRPGFKVFLVYICLNLKVVQTTVPNLVSNRKSLALSRSFASST